MSKLLNDTMELVPITQITEHPKNPNKGDMDRISESVEENGFYGAIVVQRSTGYIIVGNHRYKAAVAADLREVPVCYVDVEDDHALRILVADNRTGEFGKRDQASLTELLKELDEGIGLEGSGFTDEEFQELLGNEGGGGGHSSPSGGLFEKFIMPPFTILDSRQGPWQERKRSWKDLGIRSELGRLKEGDDPHGSTPAHGATVVKGADGNLQYKEGNGTSIFDPVLTEITYYWFSKAGDTILDPFAGGSVRGIVAARSNRNYVGVELRADQVDANIAQTDLCDGFTPPVWKVGDSRHITKIAEGKYDLLFTCPPYADLEVYSDDPADLSTLGYSEFLTHYRQIIERSCSLLEEDRFAVIVVGEVRGPKGDYYNFVGDTIQAFIDAGLSYYNEAILLTQVGSVAIRAGKSFAASRKLGKCHQNVLIFCKGDAKRAVERLGKVEVPEMEEPEDVGEIIE